MADVDKCKSVPYLVGHRKNMGDYQQAASTIHPVLAVGPGWNWSTLSSLYGDVGVYTTQLRTLEAFAKGHPDDSASRFLLAYHYMADGYPDAAERQLQTVTRLMPNDRVAADLLKMVTKPEPAQTADQAQLPTPQPPAVTPSGQPQGTVAPNTAATPTPPPVDPATLVGKWHAARPDGSQFDMTINSDATFTWKFTQKGGQPQEFGGTYTVEGNVLALERKDGGSLIAGIVPEGSGKFNFKLIGAPPEDTGLEFSK